MTNWFVNIGGQSVGPTTKEEIISQIKSGQISAASMLWKEGMTSWIPFSASELAPLLDTSPSEPKEGGPVRQNPHLSLVPPPLDFSTNGRALPPWTNDPPFEMFIRDLSKASLAERLMLGCQVIALLFVLIASFKCLDSDMMFSRGFGIFLMGHTFMLARGLIDTVSRLVGQKINHQNVVETRDKSSA